MAPPVADVFARSALICRLYFIVLVCFLFAFLTKCFALITYNRQALLDIGSFHNHLDFTFPIPQVIVRSRSRHHHHHAGRRPKLEWARWPHCLHPPRANSAAAFGALHDSISVLETVHPDAVFITTGDFNQCNLRTVFPKCYQHVDIPTPWEEYPGSCVQQHPWCIQDCTPPPLRTLWPHRSVYVPCLQTKDWKQADPAIKYIQL